MTRWPLVVVCILCGFSGLLGLWIGERSAPRTMTTAQAFNEARSTVLVYYGGGDDDDGQDVMIRCVNGNYRLPRDTDERFWVLDMPVAYNHCEVSHAIFTWPTFEYRPDLRGDAMEDRDE